VARAGVDPTKRSAQTVVGLTSTIAERVQGRAECYPSVTRLGCSSRAIAGIAGVYGDTAPDALQSLGDCSPISGINPPGAASADSAFAESPIKWTIWPLDRRAQRERRICAHVTAARRNSHFIRNSPGQSVARARRLGLFAFSRFRCPGRVWLWRGWTPSAPAQSFCSQLFQSRICCPTSRVIKDRRRRNMDWVQLPKHKGTRNVSDEADRALRSAR
jgi:hypothetical protein